MGRRARSIFSSLRYYVFPWEVGKGLRIQNHDLLRYSRCASPKAPSGTRASGGRDKSAPLTAMKRKNHKPGFYTIRATPTSVTEPNVDGIAIFEYKPVVTKPRASGSMENDLPS